jgi:hypothetical protein
MKCKELIIQTNGTTGGTEILVDGKKLGMVQQLEFVCDMSEKFARIQILTISNDVQGKMKMKTAKVRDSRTQKYVDTKIPVLAPLVLEFVQE